MNTKNLIVVMAVLFLSSYSASAQLYNSTSPVQTTGAGAPAYGVGVGTLYPKTEFQIGKKWTFQDDIAKKMIALNGYWDGSQMSRIVSGTAACMALHKDGLSFMVDNTSVTTSFQSGSKITYNSVLNLVNPGHVLVGFNRLSNGPRRNAQGREYLLYVKGGIITEEVKVELSNNWADYVFAEDYDLKSLEEVEQTIEEKGHLHNIPSAAEIEEEGLELKSMTINQQEKIEELYLHMIEMNKTVKALQAENAQLKKAINELSK